VRDDIKIDIKVGNKHLKIEDQTDRPDRQQTRKPLNVIKID
jgi:hypothetical protein